MPSDCLNEVVAFESKVIVTVGSLAVSNQPTVLLTTFSLGSCVGVSIHDPVARVGGLLHAMLPNSSTNPAKAAERPGIFVDTGLKSLLQACQQLGADKHRLRICAAGAAQFMDKSNFFNIGLRNYQQLTEALLQHSLAVAAADVGGMASRTMQLDVKTGEVRLKTSGQNSEIVL